MKVHLIPLAMVLAFAGCTMQSEEDVLENEVRNMLAGQGNVTEVELTKQGDDTLTGHANLRVSSGADIRLNCTAQREEGTRFQIRCLPAITEVNVQEIENQIRNHYTSQGQLEVLAVDLSRQDDMRMTGTAQLRAPDGTEIRTNCTATREDPNGLLFNWECAPAE